MKKILLVIVGMLIMIAIGLTAFMVNILINRESVAGGYRMQGELVKTHTFSQNDIEKIKMQVSYESVYLETTKGNEIIVEDYRGKWSTGKPVQVSEVGRNLMIEGQKNKFIFGINYDYLIVYIPEKWAHKLELNVISGSIHGENSVFNLQNLYAKSNSGSVNFDTINSEESIELISTSGSVRAGKITAKENIYLKSISGSASAESAESKNLKMESISGAVRAGDLNMKEEISLKSTSGSVSCESAVGKLLRITGNSGTIRVDNVDVKHFDIKNISGSIKMEGDAGSGDINGSSGSIELSLKQVNGDINVKNTSGAIRMWLPEDTGFHFKACTTSGSIKTPMNDKLAFDSRGKEAKGKHGKAQEYSLTASNSSGSIKIEWN